MTFLKSKAYKILSIVQICVLGLILALNLISSFASLTKGWKLAFFVIILIGALYVIGISVASIIFLAKEKRKENQDEEK